MPGITEELFGVCCPANVLRSDIPGAIAKSMLVTKTKEDSKMASPHDIRYTRHITNRKTKEIQTDPQITTNNRTTFGTCDVTSLHCLAHCLAQKMQ